MTEQKRPELECGTCNRIVLYQPRRNGRPASPDTLLRVLDDLASDIRARWPLYEATESYLAHPDLRAATGGEGRGSDVPDPVHAVVASFEHFEETKAMLKEGTSILRNLQRRIIAVLEDNPELAQEAGANMKNWRCSGEYDPICTRLADYDRGKYKGWCSRCVRAHQREEQALREAS